MATQSTPVPQQNEARSAWTLGMWAMIAMPVLEMLFMLADGAVGWEMFLLLRAAMVQIPVHFIIAICASVSIKRAPHRRVPRSVSLVTLAYMVAALLTAFIYPATGDNEEHSLLALVGIPSDIAYHIYEGLLACAGILFAAVAVVWIIDVDKAIQTQKRIQKYTLPE